MFKGGFGMASPFKRSKRFKPESLAKVALDLAEKIWTWRRKN
jgi:hypothetical protein